MSQDRPTRALRDLMREEDGPFDGDPRWEALALGKLSAGEAEALRAEAAGRAEAEDALQAFSPFDEAEIDRLSARAHAALSPAAAAAAAEAEAAAQAGGPANEATEPRAPLPSCASLPDPVVPAPVALPAGPVARQRKRGGWAAGALAAIALAAGVALFLRTPAAGLPAYELTVAGGDKTMRAAGGDSDSDEVLRLAPGSSLDVVARPSRTVTGSVEARAFALQGDRLHPLVTPLRRSGDGAFRLQGTRAALFPGVAPGRLDLIIGIAEAGAIPPRAASLAELAGSNAQILRRPLELTP
ncbi:MAG: hypothetical protein WKG00_25280 [Polyangiaceae bacterium]